MVLVLVLGFLSCIGIGIGIVKSTFQVLVLVLLSSSAKVLVLGRNFGIGQLWVLSLNFPLGEIIFFILALVIQNEYLFHAC